MNSTIENWKINTFKELLELEKKSPLNSDLHKYNYIDKLRTLTNLINMNCQKCDLSDKYCNIITDVIVDLTTTNKAPKATHRGISKSLDVIIKHMQLKHGYSLPNQFKEAWIILLASIFCITGVIISAFTLNWIYPFIGIFIGIIAGYFIGSFHDKSAYKNNTVIFWN